MRDSGKEPSKNYEESSGDQIIVVSIVKKLDFAAEYALSGDFRSAYAALNSAWAFAQPMVAEELEKPKKTFSDRVQAEVPSFVEIGRNYSFYQDRIAKMALPLTEEDFEYFQYGNENQVAIAKFRAIWQSEIAMEVLEKFTEDVVNGLDAVNLWVDKTRKHNAVVGSAQYKPTIQAPLQRLQPTYPR